MNTTSSAHSPFLLLADAVLALHFAVVVFVVGGLVMVILGNVLRWRWVNALWFRLAHLATIAVVATEAWLGWTCPLTTLELWLRANSGAQTNPAYSDSFVGYWLRQWLFYSAPQWVFVLAYTLFALVVIAAWVWFPPRSRRRATRD